MVADTPPARRMRDPHIGAGLEEYSAIVGGSVVRAPPSDADRIIHAANHAETMRRRIVRGQPVEHWYVVISDMWAWQLDREALPILADLMDAAEARTQFDSREPESYWFLRAAMVYRRLGEYGQEVAVLGRWLSHWPSERWRRNREREWVMQRLAGVRELVRVHGVDQ